MKQVKHEAEHPNKRSLAADSTPITTIPVWHRYMLTITEAAEYYHIGENKLRSIIESHPHETFYVMNGNRVLIKRTKFEEYLDQATTV